MVPSVQRRCAESRRVVTALTLAAAIAVGGGIAAPGADAHEPDDAAPAAVTMDFVPPPAGSYALPAIMRAPDGPVLDAEGRRLPLARFTAGKITLLGFIYTSCADARGCPLAYQVFHTVHHRVAQDADLRSHERPRALVPLLDGFGQDVRIETDAHGRPAGPLAHVLKVFLLDERATVREIYTTAYLFPEVIMNDIKTLRLEDRPQRKIAR